MPPPSRAQVAAALITRAGRLLACRRRADQDHPRKWEFPGGKREAGETIEECLRRELREELGIEAEVGNEVWRTEHAYPEQAPVALFFFRVDSYTGDIENRVFADMRWMAVEELGTLDFLDADRELIRQLRKGSIAI